MAVDIDPADVGLERDFGDKIRPHLGGVFRGIAELVGEDVTGPDLARFIALVTWILTTRLGKKLGLNIRPWFFGRYLLGTIIVGLKRITPPDAVMVYWRSKLGLAIDVVWDGILDGLRIRATDFLVQWGARMSEAERKTLMKPEAYAKAEAFVNKILGAGDGKAKDKVEGADGASDTTTTFGPELDYDVFLREHAESGDAVRVALEAKLQPLWMQFGTELPKHAAKVAHASLLGFMPTEDITRALLTSRTGLLHDDPEKKGAKISAQHLALKALAGFAKLRLDAHPLTLVDPEKVPDEKDDLPDPLYLPGKTRVYARQTSLEDHLNRGTYLEQALRPYGAVPLPFMGSWRTVLKIAAALLVVFLIALAVRYVIGRDLKEFIPTEPVAPTNGAQVDGGVAPRRDASAINHNPNTNNDAALTGADAR